MWPATLLGTVAQDHSASSDLRRLGADLVCLELSDSSEDSRCF